MKPTIPQLKGATMIAITEVITLNEAEVDYDFVRASGPGGQNVKIIATVKGISIVVQDLESNITRSP